MKSHPVTAPMPSYSPRRIARQGAVHALWLRRLGAAKVAWGIFIGSDPLKLKGHQERIDALRVQRKLQPRA